MIAPSDQQSLTVATVRAFSDAELELLLRCIATDGAPGLTRAEREAVLAEGLVRMGRGVR